ncbi:AI-2E family transporter [Oscillospiraceae bacterium]|nr:AI-2E family transporter [Oscillospiraceae bacterium]BDF74180.1 AI-2E family transporter [Oscillospiraceae bacterium]
MDKKLFRSILMIITYAVLLVLVIIKFDEIMKLGGFTLGLFKPVFIGFAIAFVLNKPCRAFCSLFDRGLRKTRAASLARPLAVAASYLMLILIISGIFSFVLPKLVESIQIFVNSLGGYIANLQSWADALVERFHLDALETLDFSSLDETIKKLMNGALTALSSAAPALAAFTGGVISVVVTLVLAIVFSIYMLSGQEKLLSQSRRVLRAYVPARPAGAILDVVHLTADTFTRFVTGQLIEACILGGLCALGMLFIQADYAPLVGVIIGASALIPVAGAYIGAILSAFLLVMVSPVKALIFLIFLVVLQQIEGNVIYPRVVGTSIGLPGIWVLAAVTVGGGLFGLLGILVSVPIASVLYTLLRRDVHRRLGEA